MANELELGLPPSRKKPPRPKVAEEDVPPQKEHVWHRYAATNRRLCDLCMKNANYVNGIPTRVINKAWWTEDGPDGRLWLCHPCKADRMIRFGKPGKR